MKNPITFETLLAADNVLDLSRIRDVNEYDRDSTIDKSKPFGFLKLDEASNDFNFIYLTYQ
ncbi:hypothetical protein [Flavobacterium sp. DG2-3]|uniref:hypothetical protein n=1 Tax=Flavobacterium sp. DG2-3 TaxID=3068317 RepID=UPI002740297A|nr:hypothetical protein [Flavobacterium sp. DG2-3]MDP5200220.1 hypothetical protein [Flavobacterium sp. DG2-3]